MSVTLPTLPARLTARALTGPDAQAVVDIVGACEVAEFGEVFVEIEDVWSDWARPAFDLATDSIGVELDGRLIAVAEVFKGRRAEVNVHPDHQGGGIGTALMLWTWEQARRHGSPLIGETVSDGNEAAARLFRAHGYDGLWRSWVLELPPETPIAAVEPAAGITIRPVRLDAEEEAVFHVIEDAFNEWPDREPSSYPDWAPSVFGRAGFEPWQLLVAARPGEGGGDELVGVCYLIMSGSEGWVQQIAVRRDHRGQGLARCLLASSFGTARARGATRFGLSTDSRTGALGLYERVGMTVRLTFRHWARRMT